MGLRIRDGGGLLWAFVAVALWSGFAALVVFALRSLSPTGVLVWSYLPAALTTTMIHRKRKGSWRDAVVAPPRLVFIGLLGALGWAGGTVVALHRGPIVQANLVTYLWPLLIVVLAPLAGERFSRRYLLAAGIGLAGTVLVVTGGHTIRVASTDAATYALAASAALSWALYTVLLRRMGHANRHTALFVNYAFAITLSLAVVTGNLRPPSGTALVACLAIGVGPLAIAFVAWDRAVTLTSVARVGVFSYLDPMLSTLFLIVFLNQSLTAATTVGMILIVTASVVAETRAVEPRDVGLPHSRPGRAHSQNPTP